MWGVGAFLVVRGVAILFHLLNFAKLFPILGSNVQTLPTPTPKF